MRMVDEIMKIPDVNGDFPVRIAADHGLILIESQGALLDEMRLGVLTAALETARLVAARQRAATTEAEKD